MDPQVTVVSFLIAHFAKRCSAREGMAQCRRLCATLIGGAQAKEIGLKGSQKPKSAQKKPAQKTLKERRAEKKAAAKIRGIAE